VHFPRTPRAKTGVPEAEALAIIQRAPPLEIDDVVHAA